MRKDPGRPLSIPHCRGRIHAAFNEPSFVEAISDCRSLLDREDAEILLDSRNRVGVVRLPRRDGKYVEVVVKEFRSGVVSMLKSAFLPGKARKSWLGGMALLDKGVETPRPIAYLERRKGPFAARSFYLAERVSGVEEIRFLFRQLPEKELRGLLVSLSRQLAHCHREGVLHCDLSDGNVLVRRERSGEYVFYFLDTNRIRAKRKLCLGARVKNLIRLGIPPDFQRFFLEQYLRRAPVPASLWFWYRLNKTAYAAYIRLKKMLGLRALTRKLRI